MDTFDPGMPEDVWKKVRAGAGQVLGQRFWTDIAGLIPKRTEPPCDLFRLNSGLMLTVEIPGLFDPRDITITVSGRMLHLRGAKRRAFPVTNENSLLSECSYGDFHRTVELPEDIEPSQVTAQCRHGVLTIYMLLQPAQDEQSIDVHFDEGHAYREG